MRQIEILQNQLDYVGLFAAPAFRLFANPAALASGLYHVFQGYHSGADDIRLEGDPAQPLRQTCAVDLGEHGSYRVSLERVEWMRPAAWSRELNSSILANGDSWLRSIVGNTLMHSHYFTYTAHASPLAGTARDAIIEMGGPSLPGFGESEGTGLIFHTKMPLGNHPVQFTVDHSHEVQDGLYFELVVSLEHDLIDYAQTGSWLLDTIHRAFHALGLVPVTGLG
jgi:hypothetical protein